MVRGFGLILGISLLALASGMEAKGDVALGAEAVRIGTVDMQRALQGVETGKKARGQLEKDFNQRKKELQNEENAIKKMGDEFKKQSLVLSDEARMKKQQEIQERILKFQEFTARSQMEIQQKEQELTAPIVQSLREIIGKLAKERNYTVVLERNENTVLFSLEKDDLTEEVIKLYNGKGKS